MLRANAMTIGQLSRRTGVPIKVLREYERLGFLYTLGRSASNYRLFGEEAVWCVQVTQGLRSLGLTLNDIRELVTRYLEHPDERDVEFLDQHLAEALMRVETRIADLQALRQRILDVQAALAGAQASRSASELLRLLATDPRRDASISAR
jgi:MerR family transcriptional regulator, copper efflux regulator